LARQNIAPWTAANGSQNYISYNSDNMQNRQLFGNSSNNSPLLGQQPGAQFNAGRGTQNGIAAKDGEIPQATNSDALTDLRKGAENQAAAQGQNNAKYNNEAAARVIQVQATRLQIHAAVAEMKSRPMPFLAVNIRPSADFPLDEPTADRHAGVLARKRAATVTHPSSPSKAAGGLAGDATSPAAAAASVPAPKSPADATSAGLKGSMSKSEQSSAGEAGKKQAEDGYGLKGATSVPGAAKGGGVAEKAAAAPEPTYLVLFVVHVASPAQATPSPTR
jgi:hypothetical protein